MSTCALRQTLNITGNDISIVSVDLDSIHETIQSSNQVLNISKEYGSVPSLERRISSPKKRDHGAEKPHCHNGPEGELLDKKARRKLILASILCLLFMIGEIIGGVLANSLAIATDAAHLLTDFASFMISLFAIYLASRPATKRMSFGWHRAEVMGALVSVLMIWVVTGVLVYMAIERIRTNEYEIDATVMLITAGIGVLVNLIMGCTLHDHGHSHGGGSSQSHGKDSSHSHGKGSSHSHEEGSNHSHDSSHSRSSSENDTIIDVSETCGDDEDRKLIRKEAREKQNINVRAAFIHVVGDFIQSAGVFIAALIIFFRPDWKIADPICTFLFSLLVLFTTLAILKDTLLVLMEGTPRGMSFSSVKEALTKIEGVKELHNLRIWSLTMNKSALAVHLAADGTVDSQVIMQEAARVMKERFGVSECTIQVEAFTKDMADCTQCKDPAD